MYVHLSSLRSLARGRGGPLTLRRLLGYGGFAALYSTMLGVVQAARAADRLIFPAYRQVPVTRPVFIVATPRSGSTFLHHLLALDEKTFTHFKLYQTVFPSVLIYRLVQAFAEVERDTDLPLSALVRAVNRRMFTNWEGIHEVGLDGEEEDECLFVYSLLTPALYLLYPFLDAVPDFKDFDALPDAQRVKIAKSYRSSLQRHLLSRGLSREGKARTMLIKNVLLPSRIHTTLEAFPDARIIHLVRDPRRAIPSAMSMFYATWQAFSPEITRTSKEARALGEMFLGHYEKLCKLADDSPAARDGRVLTVRFEDLVGRPIETVERVYGFLGNDVHPEHRAILEQKLARPEAFKSAHNYSLADFGMTDDDVLVPLGKYVAELGYANSAGSGLADAGARSYSPAQGPAPEAARKESA